MYRNSLLPVLDVASAVSSGKHALLSQERHDDGCRRIWQITLPYARSEGAEKLLMFSGGHPALAILSVWIRRTSCALDHDTSASSCLLMSNIALAFEISQCQVSNMNFITPWSVSRSRRRDQLSPMFVPRTSSSFLRSPRVLMLIIVFAAYAVLGIYVHQVYASVACNSCAQAWLLRRTD